MGFEKINLSLELKTNNEISILEKGKPGRIFLCLHGYLLNGEYMLEEFSELLGDNCLIIAPNGPFLVPVKKDEKYFPKYSWYFFDPIEKNYYINYDPAADFLAQILRECNPDNLPVTVIGYSQGGYLAPRVVNFDDNIDHVISLASVYRPDRFEVKKNVQYTQINSKQDLIVNYKEAENEGSKMKQLTSKYELLLIEESGHRVDRNYKEKLKAIL